VSEASEGRFGPSPLHVYDNWDSYCAWAGTASLPAGDAFVPSAADAPVLAPRQIYLTVGDEVLTQVGDQSMRHTAVALTPSTQETP